jgi:chemotaxis protein methyltransferase CheR
MTQHALSGLTAGPPTDSELASIARILHQDSGIVLAEGKASMVQSRLAKRLRALKIQDYQGYIDFVQTGDGASERKQMISALTTNVTNFFRENHHFDFLREQSLPPLIEHARAGGRVRIWSAGASNGQEAYSIAMTLAELAPDVEKLDIRILASDIDPVMVAYGAEARYNQSTVEAIPQALRHKYFLPDDDQYRAVPKLRNMITFRELNLHSPWPMQGKFDIIFCRNVVIYFDTEAEITLWRRFEAALIPGGYLHVGHSERVPLEQGFKLITAGITTYRRPLQIASESGEF